MVAQAAAAQAAAARRWFTSCTCGTSARPTPRCRRSFGASNYLAFAREGTRGDKHLRALAAAGVTHGQLLPTYAFGSVP